MEPFELQDTLARLSIPSISLSEKANRVALLQAVLRADNATFCHTFCDLESVRQTIFWLQNHIAERPEKRTAIFQSDLDRLRCHLPHLTETAALFQQLQAGKSPVDMYQIVSSTTLHVASIQAEHLAQNLTRPHPENPNYWINVTHHFRTQIFPIWEDKKIDVTYREHILNGLISYHQLLRDMAHNTFGVVVDTIEQQGHLLELHLTIHDGAFDVKFTNLDVEASALHSLRMALMAAERISGASPGSHSVEVQCLRSSPTGQRIDGESLGLTLAVGAVAQLLKLPLRDKKIVLTGRLWGDGMIANVGFIDFKMKAAARQQMNAFICPATTSSACETLQNLAVHRFRHLQDVIKFIWSEGEFEAVRQKARFSVQFNDPASLSLDVIPHVHRFIGRSAEINALQRMLDTEKIAVIEGPAGVGKSTLGAELSRLWTGDALSIFWYEFDEIKQDMDTFLRYGAAFLARNGDPHLWRHLEAESGSKNATLPMSQKINLFCRGIETGAYLICLDDMHEVANNPDFRHLLRAVRNRLVASRLIIMTRLHLKPLNDLHYDFLTGLDRDDALQFLNVNHVHVPDALFELLYSRTEGYAQLLNLFVGWYRYRTRSMAEVEDFLQRSPTEMQQFNNYLNDEVMELLTEAEKKTLQAASVYREPVITGTMIATLIEKEEKELHMELATLQHRHILTKLQHGYQIHALTRDYVKDSLKKDQWPFCEVLHTRAARSWYGANQDWVEGCWHLLEAGQYPECFQIYREHPDEFLQSGRNEDVLEIFNQLLENLDDATDLLLIYDGKCELLRIMGQNDALAITLEEARNLAQKSQNLDYSHQFLLKRISLHLVLSELEQAHTLIEELQSRLDPNQDRLRYGELLLQLGRYHARLDNHDLSYDYFQQAYDMFDALNNQYLKTRALDGISVVHFHWGNYPIFLDYSKRIMQLAEEIGNRMVYIRMHFAIALGYMRQGRFSEALRYSERSLELCLEIGHVDWISASYTSLGGLYRCIGNFEKSLNYLNSGLRLREDLGALDQVGFSLMNIAEVYKNIGDLEEYRAYSEKAFEMFTQVRSRLGLCLALDNFGTYKWLVGDFENSVADFERAIEIKKEIQCRGEYGFTYTFMIFPLIELGRFNYALQMALAHFKNIQEIGIDVENGRTHLGIALILAAGKLTREDQSIMSKLQTYTQLEPEPDAYFKTAINTARSAHFFQTLIPAQFEYGRFLVENKARDEGINQIQASYDLSHELGTTHELQRISAYCREWDIVLTNNLN